MPIVQWGHPGKWRDSYVRLCFEAAGPAVYGGGPHGGGAVVRIPAVRPPARLWPHGLPGLRLFPGGGVPAHPLRAEIRPAPGGHGTDLHHSLLLYHQQVFRLLDQGAQPQHLLHPGLGRGADAAAPLGYAPPSGLETAGGAGAPGADPPGLFAVRRVGADAADCRFAAGGRHRPALRREAAPMVPADRGLGLENRGLPDPLSADPRVDGN